MKPVMQKQYSEFGFAHQVIAVIGDERFDLSDLEQSEKAIVAAYNIGIDDRMVEEEGR